MLCYFSKNHNNDNITMYSAANDSRIINFVISNYYLIMLINTAKEVLFKQTFLNNILCSEVPSQLCYS